MKLFLDYKKTFLPRLDVIYLLTRIVSLLGTGWIVFVVLPDGYQDPLLLAAIVSQALLIGLLGVAIRGWFDLRLAYLGTIAYDLLFVPMFIWYTGGVDSGLYLLFFITGSVSAYVLTFSWAAAVAVIITLGYILILFTQLDPNSLYGVVMRLGFFWVYFLAISYVSEHMRKSESRLLKLFDTLNLRTAELEKSQLQLEMIHENSRILASILDTDQVVKEVMRIVTSTLRYSTAAVVLKTQGDQLFFQARHAGGQSVYQPQAIDVIHQGLIGKVVENQEAVNIRDVGSRADYEPLDTASTVALLIPLTSHGKTHGLLIAESPTENFFSEREIQMLQVVARSAALALENAELHRRTAELSIIDELTGAFNYRYFVQKFEEEKRRSLRYRLPLSLVMIDIDWFKKLNDAYGHEVGNIVLRRLSEIVAQTIRDVDIFARYGGEEFAIILPQTPLVEARRLAERIRETIEATAIDTGETGVVRITVSVGVSSFPENGRSQEELISSADHALYEAKGSGKNMVAVG